MAKDYPINRATGRSRLKPQREPYWRALAPRQHIGYRKTAAGGETWIARYREDDGKRTTKPLGRLSELSYTDAKELAEEWFASCNHGIVRSDTVEEACKAYVKHIATRKPGREVDPKGRFTRHIYDTDFGKIPLDKLRVKDVVEWRDSLIPGRSPNSVNRTFRTFKAAMNLAYRNEQVNRDHAWRAVEPLPTERAVDKIFLDSKQRKALLEACPGPLAAFLKGMIFTGARPDEIARLTAGDVDTRSNTLRMVNYKGRTGDARERGFPVAGDALVFFKEQKKDKLPAAPLLPFDDGTAWTKDRWTKHLKEVVKTLVPDLPLATTAYAMRHTTISEWLQAGVDIATVAKLTGTSVNMIDKHYHKFIASRVEDKLASIKLL